ncbi:uncharacterized protein NPIL_149281 [Nephila pilipes]|uniref:Uncharacterized protein n=1 Tax=Nephila pilipes TaxID=299642 RepID=A0A8X6NEB6_NEPPI|nr:uncharacterized protein NPIL_149281 [Nephila pilipes]
MHSYLILLFAFGITFSYGYGLIEGENNESNIRERNLENIQNSLQEDSSDATVEEDEGIETVEVDDTVSSKDEFSENSEKLLKDLESKFTAMLLRFFDREDLYKDARFSAIIDALKTAVYTITGNVNHDYIESIVKMVRSWDDDKRRQFNEIALNRLGMTETDVEERFWCQEMNDINKQTTFCRDD